MSSVVSRRPPACAPTSQSNDRRWMSMRLGTSRDLFRRAKERRARGAATLGKTATPQGVERRTGQQGGGALRGKARLSKIARGKAAPAGGHSALTDPARSGRVCGAAPVIWAATTIGRPRKGSASARFAPPLRCAPPAPAPPSASAAPSAARRDGVETTEGRPPGAPPRAAVLSMASLLELDAPAGLLELGLELLGLVALDALLDGLGRLVDEGLGLLEAEAGRRADDLDHLDLLVAGGGEDDVDRRARLLLGAAAVAGGRGGRGRGDGRRRDAELLLERLDALGQLEHRDALELVDPLLGRSHVCDSSCRFGRLRPTPKRPPDRRWWSCRGRPRRAPRARRARSAARRPGRASRAPAPPRWRPRAARRRSPAGRRRLPPRPRPALRPRAARRAPS